jgi:hypothetical protein
MVLDNGAAYQASRAWISVHFFKNQTMVLLSMLPKSASMILVSSA